MRTYLIIINSSSPAFQFQEVNFRCTDSFLRCHCVGSYLWWVQPLGCSLTQYCTQGNPLEPAAHIDLQPWTAETEMRDFWLRSPLCTRSSLPSNSRLQGFSSLLSTTSHKCDLLRKTVASLMKNDNSYRNPKEKWKAISAILTGHFMMPIITQTLCIQPLSEPAIPAG